MDRKTVVLTFDGGTRDHFTILLPFLRRMGVKATCFVSDSGMRDAEHLKPMEMQEMVRSGLIELGGWLDVATDDPAALRQTVVRGRRWLTGVTGRLPMAFAYARPLPKRHKRPITVWPLPRARGGRNPSTRLPSR